MDYRIVCQPDPLDGGYIAGCPDLPGCFGQGDTHEAAVADALDAIEAWLAADQEGPS